MNKKLRISAMLVLLFALCSGAIFAQSTSGSITGIVVDSQEAAISNAAITITEQGKKFTLTSVTDENGRFVFPQVQPGIYTMEIVAAGFKKQARKDLTLVSNDKIAIGNVALEIGEVSEIVTVTSDATPIQSESADRSYAIQGEVVRNLGVKNRSFVNLATLAPGVVATTADGSTGDISSISVNGVRTNSNNIQIDGVTTVDTGNNGSSSNIPLDSIEEVKILTATYQAEYGRSSGAQIIAATRSGKNDFHGSAYYYRQHTGLNANTFNNNARGLDRPISDQEQKGFSIGGPVYFPRFGESGPAVWSGQNKLFFFVNEEWAPRTTPNTARNVRVPTLLERQGDFSQSLNSSGQTARYIRDYTRNLPCTAANTTGCFQDGGVVGKIPQNRLNAFGLQILSIYPMPNFTPTGTQNYNYVTQISSVQTNRNDTVRIDYNISDAWRVNTRILYNELSLTNPYTGVFNDSDMIAGNIGIWGLYRETPKLGISGTVSGTINATTALEVTYGFNKSKYLAQSDPAYTRTGLGLQNLPVLYNGAVVNDILGSFTFGTALGPGPNYRTQRAPQDYGYRTDNIAASMSKVWTNHVTKVGVNYEWGTKNQTNRVDQNGVINFAESTNNPFDTGNGFANALTGTFQEFRQSTQGTKGIYKYLNLEPYIQDNWKISKRLTLDYGMRFSWLPPTEDKTGLASNFFPNQWKSANAPRVYRPVCIGAGAATCSGVSLTSRYRAVDPAVLASGVTLTTANTLLGSFVGRIVPGSGNIANGLSLIDGPLTRDQGIQFSPRLGFAWDVTGKQNFIVRGGFAIFYDRAQGNLVFDFNQNLPTTFTSSVFNAFLGDITANATSFGNPQPVNAIDPDSQVPTTNSYNFGIQYKVPLIDTVLDIAYVGSQSHHLPHNRPLNETPFGSAFLPINQDPTKAVQAIPNGANALLANSYRPYLGFAAISYTEFSENSNYNSLQVSANRRFSKRILVNASYTLSRALGITSNDDGNARIDGKDFINYGRLSFDRTHNFVINTVYELPSVTKNRFLGLAANGWQLSGIYRFTTGAPRQFTCSVTGVSAVNITGSTSGEANRCILVGDPLAIDSKSEYQQFNINAFQAPSVGSTGLETPRRDLQISDRPINNFDLSLSKKFYFWEKINVEGRLDAFNALNHTQPSGINTSGTFTALGSTTLNPNNVGSETNRTGYGAINGWRPNRTLQWMVRFTF